MPARKLLRAATWGALVASLRALIEVAEREGFAERYPEDSWNRAKVALADAEAADRRRH